MYTGIIYKYTSPSNKVYVGQTINEYNRKNAFKNIKHLYAGGKIDKARLKYGPDNFQYEVLETIQKDSKKELLETLNNLEVQYITKYDSFKSGYNSTPGGDSGRLGFKHSEETIQKLRKSHENYKPKRAFDVSKKTFGYDLLNKVFIEGESIADISHKVQVDYRSIGQICNNDDFKSGGRFISGKRYLFSFTKEDLINRINWYYSEEYNYKKKHRKNDRFQ